VAQEPRRPQDWRDWVRADYEYPEDFDDLSRSQRRQAKRRWRRQDQAQRVAWLRDQRGAEPSSPGGLVVAIVFLVIVVIGFGAALPRLLHGDSGDRPSIGLLTPAPNPPPGASTGPGGPVSETSGPGPTGSASPSSQPSSAPTSLPVTSNRASAAQVSAASTVVGAWAKVFYTRNPAIETYEQLVAKAGRYTTDAVSASFTSAGDSTYEALRTSQGTSRVIEAPVTAPRKGTAPVDTPSRITRLVSVKVQVTGSKPATLTVPLLVTVVPQDGDWVISDVNGGAGT
jgi:hypothetical protein